MKKQPLRWLISGVWGGLGRALAEAALERGDCVAGTVREAEQAADFEALAPGRSLAYLCDMGDPHRVHKTVTCTFKALRGLDVLVNNVGYPLLGAIEEVSMDEARAMMEKNFFRALHLTRTALPYLRRSGHPRIVNISSQEGFSASAASGLYAASKFALEGLGEALHEELRPLGVRVTLVEPGRYQAAWGGNPTVWAEHTLPEYQDCRRELAQILATQEVPDKHLAAQAILKVVDSADPPLRLPLGRAALERVRAKISALQAELDVWEELSLASEPVSR